MLSIGQKKIKIGVIGLIGIVLVVLVILFGDKLKEQIPIWYFQIFVEKKCQKLEATMNQQIENANYCKTDEDCKIESFDCPFGCGSYVNKGVDTALIKEQVSSYHQECGRCKYGCVRPLNPVCQNQKCVETKALCRPDKIYVDLSQCRCPEGTEKFVEAPEGGKEVILICKTNKTNTTCKDDDFYAQQAMSFKYRIQGSSVAVSGCLANHPGSGCQDKTLNLALTQQFYLASGKEQSVKVVLEKIENNKAHFIFSYGAAPPACETIGGCDYTCEFIK